MPTSKKVSTGRSLFKDNFFFFINKGHGNETLKTHSHDFIEISYVSAGTGIHYINDNKYMVKKGDLFIINNHVEHCFISTNKPNNKLTIYNCIFWPEFIDTTLKNTHDFKDVAHHILFQTFFPDESPIPNIQLIDQECYLIESILENMYIEYHTKNNGYSEMLKTYTLQLLITIFRHYQEYNNLNSPLSVKQSEIVENIIAYLNNNYNTNISLQEICDNVFSSKSTICRIFKENTGMTIMEYAQKIRINEACNILQNNTLKIVDVASAVGYNDLKYFNKLFKRVTGQTPSEYRKEKK